MGTYLPCASELHRRSSKVGPVVRDNSQHKSMPQPFKPNRNFCLASGHQILKGRSAHAAGIGLVVAEWSALEHELIAIVANVLFFEEPTVTANVVAETAWASMESLRARLQMLDALAEDMMPTDLLGDFRERLLPEVRKRASERNRIAHGNWYVDAEAPDLLVLLDRSRGYMAYSVKDFNEIAARITATCEQAHLLLEQVATRRKSTRQGAPGDRI
jgi:hypothetical protein